MPPINTPCNAHWWDRLNREIIFLAGLACSFLYCCCVCPFRKHSPPTGEQMISQLPQLSMFYSSLDNILSLRRRRSIQAHRCSIHIDGTCASRTMRGQCLELSIATMISSVGRTTSGSTSNSYITYIVDKLQTSLSSPFGFCKYQ